MRFYPKDAPTDPRPKPTLRTLNLGAGTQSSALALMHLDGTLPPIDAAIFADTGWEPKAVYTHLAKLRDAFDTAGVPLLIVGRESNIRDDALNEGHRSASIPVFIKKEDGDLTVARRQCTQEYKISPIRRAIRELLAERLGIELRTFRTLPKDVYVEQVFGISTDEAIRAKRPRDRWSINYYPLLELGWRRDETIAYLRDRGWEAPRSACIGCPYRTDASWRQIRDQDPAEFQDAVEFDAAIRQQETRFNGEMFLHRSLLPLADVDLSTPEELGQLSMLAVCDEGVCGV